jgi:hypothetical protein
MHLQAALDQRLLDAVVQFVELTEEIVLTRFQVDE